MPKTHVDFFKAAQNRDLATLIECLEDGVDINTTGDQSYRYSVNSNAWTALHWAAYKNDIEAVQYLLDHGADVHMTDTSGRTALILARKSDRAAAIISLLDAAERRQSTPEWSLFGTEGVAHVEISPKIRRQLTEIFNFATRERLLITENLQSGAESVIPPTKFDDLPPAVIEKALENFKILGGVTDEDAALHGLARIQKRKNGL